MSLLKLAATIAETKFPSVWKAVNTKSINNPGSHQGAQSVAAIFAHSIYDCVTSGADAAGNSKCIAEAAAIMQAYDYPLYYVSKNLIEALKRTEPPADTRWDSLTFPFPGLVFMLPRGSVLETLDGSSIFCAGIYQSPTKPERIMVPGINSYIDAKDDHLNLISVFWISESCVTGYASFDKGNKLHLAKWASENVNRNYTDGYEMTNDELLCMVDIVGNLLLVMSARPEIVESGGSTGKTFKSGLPLHQPTFIGRKYEIIRKTPIQSTGAHFTELRWRAGHMKRQHFGIKNQETKIIFVDPYMAYSAGLIKEV